jgi:hypothetical protein
MKNFLLIIALLIMVGSVSAQKRTIEMNKNYANAKIVQIGKGIVPVKNMMLVSDTLLQYTSKGGDGSIGMKQISVSNVRYVKIKKGSYFGIGALAGGGMGLLSAVYGVLTVKSDPSLDDSGVNWAPFIIGFTAGGALIGGIVGVCIPKWKTYFLPDRSTSFSIKFTPSISPAYCGLGMKMKF